MCVYLRHILAIPVLISNHVQFCGTDNFSLFVGVIALNLKNLIVGE